MTKTEGYTTVKWFIDQFILYVDDNDMEIVKQQLEPHVEPFIKELLAKSE